MAVLDWIVVNVVHMLFQIGVIDATSVPRTVVATKYLRHVLCVTGSRVHATTMPRSRVLPGS